MKFKKGLSMAAAPGAVIMLVIIGAIAVIGTSINDSMLASDTTSADLNATVANASLGILEVTGNLSLLGLIIIMGIVITVLLASFGGFLGGRGGL